MDPYRRLHHLWEAIPALAADPFPLPRRNRPALCGSMWLPEAPGLRLTETQEVRLIRLRPPPRIGQLDGASDDGLQLERRAFTLAAIRDLELSRPTVLVPEHDRALAFDATPVGE